MWLYGMRLRPYSIGCQPKGVIEVRDGGKRYWNIIAYKNKLPLKDELYYDLDCLGEETLENGSKTGYNQTDERSE